MSPLEWLILAIIAVLSGVGLSHLMADYVPYATAETRGVLAGFTAFGTALYFVIHLVNK